MRPGAVDTPHGGGNLTFVSAEWAVTGWATSAPGCWLLAGTLDLIDPLIGQT